ncbi:MAG: TetR/AcrR family transcriptional regulator [Pseudomonadota bacterium]
MGNKVAFRPRNADATKESILQAARAEFAEAGLGGARVDSIAERSGTNKRMIYHYFGGKDDLFSEVIAAEYEGIRAQELDLGLEALPPAEAINKLVEFTWNYYIDNPELITLVNSENLHKARHLAGHSELHEMQLNYVELVKRILQRGADQGVFRRDVDPVQFCITLAAIGYYYLTNQYTGQHLFGFNFTEKKALQARLRFNLDTIRRLLAVDPPPPQV